MNLKMLDVVIGVVFFYTFASLICTTIRELIESLIATKAKMLEVALREILDDETPGSTPNSKSVLVRFYEHPLIDSLFKGDYSAATFDNSRIGNLLRGFWRALFGNRNLPAYIPADHFASAVLDIVAASAPQDPTAPPADKKAQFLALRAALERSDFALKGAPKAKAVVPGERLRSAILWAFDNADEDIDKARKNLESWFDNSMERVTGWYKRQTHAWLLLIGACVAVVFNLNSLEVVKKLYVDDAMRAAVLAEATRATGDENSRNQINQPDGAPAQNPSAAQSNKIDVAKGARPASRDAAPPSSNAGQSAARPSSPTEQGSEPAANPPPQKTAEIARSVEDAEARVEKLKHVLDDVGYPIGWTEFSWGKFRKAWASPQWSGSDGALVAWYVSGWLLTAIAMTLGASFWFDLLNKLVSLRTSLKPEPAPRQTDDAKP